MTPGDREEARDVRDVVVLCLDDRPGAGVLEGCAVPAAAPRATVLAGAAALRAGGVTVRIVTAASDAEIDATLAETGPPEADLVVAAATDGHLRAVLRRMVRRYAPPPSQRPSDLPADRTVPDLPAIGVLPLVPAAAPPVVLRLGLPVDPAAVAAAVLGRRTRRFDLLRHDGGSVTVHGALLGGVDPAGAALAWRGRVEVDDRVLTDGEDPIVACAVTNTGQSAVDGLCLVEAASAEDGLVHVAVAVPLAGRRRRTEVRFEVRRARGRAVAVLPRQTVVPFVDDGVAGELSHKRSWWVERAVWAAYIA
jgi:hypothetical protein